MPMPGIPPIGGRKKKPSGWKKGTAPQPWDTDLRNKKAPEGRDVWPEVPTKPRTERRSFGVGEGDQDRQRGKQKPSGFRGGHTYQGR